MKALVEASWDYSRSPSKPVGSNPQGNELGAGGFTTCVPQPMLERVKDPVDPAEAQGDALSKEQKPKLASLWGTSRVKQDNSKQIARDKPRDAPFESLTHQL